MDHTSGESEYIPRLLEDGGFQSLNPRDASTLNTILARLDAGTRFGTHRVLSKVLDFAVSKLSAQSVVLEPYTSTDWADEYQALYSRVFYDFPRTTLRLHFFRGTVNASQLFDPISKIGSFYLGYCVLRPLPSYTVSETVLESPFKNPAEGYVHCLAEFESHIMGHKFSVKGMPFLQQDRVVSVCAEADLWMVARYLNAKNIVKRFRPSEMAKLASQAFSIGAIRDGLIVEQMFNALKAMGLNVDMAYPSKRSAGDHLRLIYSLVKSEIPVIIAIPNHVMTVIGYVYNHERNGLGINDSFASYVKAFIVHNDSMEPYQKLVVGQKKRDDAEDPHNTFKFLTVGEMKENWIEQCLWVLPDRVNLRESDVRAHVDKWLKKYIPALFRELWKNQSLDKLVTCIYLRRSDQFKRDIIPQPRVAEIISNSDSPQEKPARHKRLTDYYWHMRLPRFIWVVELSREEDIPENSPWERKLVGEMIFDSTSHFEDHANSLLAVHIAGKLVYRKQLWNGHPRFEVEQTKAGNDPWNIVDDLNTGPYSALHRDHL